MSNWPTQPSEEDPEQARDRAERLHHQEAVTRWRTPPAEPPRSDRGQSTGVPAVSTGNGSYLGAPWHDWE